MIIKEIISPTWDGSPRRFTKVVIRGWYDGPKLDDAALAGGDAKEFSVQFTLAQVNGVQHVLMPFVRAQSKDFNSFDVFLQYVLQNSQFSEFFSNAQMRQESIRSCLECAKSTDITFKVSQKPGGSWCAILEHVRIAKLLGARLDEQDAEGNTFLHNCSDNQLESASPYAHFNDFDFDLKNKKGISAIERIVRATRPYARYSDEWRKAAEASRASKKRKISEE